MAEERIAFVTVGSTRFDALVAGATCWETLDAFHAHGVRKLVVQYGAGSAPEAAALGRCAQRSIQVEMFRWEPDIGARLQSAWIVLSHGGAGTLIEASSMQCRVVAVVNKQLMDDHQKELVNAFDEAQCIVKAVSEHNIADAVRKAAGRTPMPLPPRQDDVMGSVVDQELGLA